MPTSWAVTLTSMIAFVIAALWGDIDTQKVITNVVRAICYTSIMVGISFLVWYLGKNSAEYYRWNEQEWWTGDSDEDDFEELNAEMNSFLSF